MMRTLTLEIPEETFVVIEEQAKEKDVAPEKWAGELLSAAVRHVEEAASDPLIALFGTIDSPVTDVAERHDYYIGQALFKELRAGSSTD